MIEIERQSVIKNVNISWVSDILEMCWAESGSEVPIWDYSRGFPFGYNLYWARGHKIDLENDEEVKRYIRASLKDERWEPKPPPEKDYPRLVRKSAFDVGKSVWIEESDVLNEITALIAHRNNEFDLTVTQRNKNKILRLYEGYGMVDDSRYLYNATAQRWIVEAYRVHANIEGLNVLQDEGLLALKDHSAVKHVQWIKDLKAQNPFHRHFYSPYLDISQGIKDTETVQEARERIAERLLQAFSHRSRHTFALNLGSILYSVTITRWLSLLLAGLWLKGSTITTCEGCGRLFVLNRRDRKFCHSRCRVNYHNAKARRAVL